MVGTRNEPKSPKNAAKKSPVKPKSPGRSKSPGRPKSPTRSPARPKKDEVKSKSPSRGRTESPSRAKSKPITIENVKTMSLTKETKEETKSKRKSGRLTPTRRSPIRKNLGKTKTFDEVVPHLKKRGTTFDMDTDSDTAFDEVGIKEKPKATVKGRSRADIELEANESIEIGGGLLKRITRSQNREVERIVHLNKQFEPPKNKLGEFSDEDELFKTDTKSVESPKKQWKVDWIGVGTNIFILAVIIGVPVAVGIALGTCDKNSCVVTEIPKQLPTLIKPAEYFNKEVVLAYFGYFVLLTSLSALPIGFKVDGLPDKQGKLTYNANGIIVALMLVLIGFGLEYRNIKVADFIINHLSHMFVVSVTTGFLLSFFAYVRSFYVPVTALNPRIIGKGKLENFFWGRETHPRLLQKVDLKLCLVRLAVVGILLVDMAYIFRAVTTTVESHSRMNETSRINVNLIKNLKATPVLYFSLHLLFILDHLFHEKQWISSSMQQEGFGYNFAVLSSVYPFASALVTKYVVEHQVSLATWQLILAGMVGIFGLVYHRLCNRQRDGFLRNPYSPSFKRYESISTNQGTKILTSGLYSNVRFPHYFGEILMNLSLTPFVLCATPVFVLYAGAISLIYRAHRDDKLARQKFANAWERYCHKAKHLLLQKVY